MNFIKNQIAKLSMLALLIGLGITAVGLFTMFQERNVTSDPTAMQAADMPDPGSELIYATVEGGTLDLANSFESQIKRKRRTLKTEYFVPVLENGLVSYVLQTDEDPGSITAGSFTGLLKSSSDLPGELVNTYQKVFQGQTYPLLDAGYKPESTMAKFKKLGLFIGLAVAGLIGMILTRRKPDPRMGQVRTHG